MGAKRVPPIVPVAVGALGVATGFAAAGLGGWMPQEISAAACATAWGALMGVACVGAMSPGLQIYGPALVRWRCDRPRVALTFDDGPDPASTPAILETLAGVGAGATFFVLVDRALRHPDLFRAIAASQEVGLHGVTHTASLTVRDPRKGAVSILEGLESLYRLSPGLPSVRWYRPPFGASSPRSVDAVRRAGLTTAWCSVRTLDGLLPGEERLRRVCARASAGDIVLMHEGRRPVARALGPILDDLAGRGLSAVPLGKLVEP